MSTSVELPTLEALRGAKRAEKVTSAWQDALWAHWPKPEQWPATMDICEAAAYKRVNPATIRNACANKTLTHQRIGAAYRLNRADLDQLGRVERRLSDTAV